MGTYLSRTPASSVAAERRKFTFSCWYKRCQNGASSNLIAGDISGSSYTYLAIQSDDTIRFRLYDGGNQADIQSNDVFRDPASWYHFVLQFDSTQSTSTDRVKIYVNNRQITSLQANTYPSQDYSSWINHNVEQRINSATDAYSYYAEVHQTGNQIYAPSSFGETDSTTGEWKPKSVSGLSYGTNGFHLKFENAGAMGTDSSGNSNTFTVNNAGTNPQVTDTPSNVFMTMNPLASGSRGSFSRGNTKVQLNLQGSVPYGQVEFGTFAVNKGKWYFEVKNLSAGGGGKMGLGISEKWETNQYINGHNNVGSVGNAFYSNQGDVRIGSGSDQTASSYTDNDIIGVAFDLDNSKVYFHKNGSYQRSGDPANGTGGDTLTSSYNDYWTPWITKDSDNSAHNPTVEFNFGNPAFSISSGNADASGFGNFEYAVPSGYFALCTKNLNTYG